MVSPTRDDPPVRIETDGAVTTIQLCRPPLNPLDTTMPDALIAAIRAVADGPDVRACVVHGGTENFAAADRDAAMTRFLNRRRGT